MVLKNKIIVAGLITTLFSLSGCGDRGKAAIEGHVYYSDGVLFGVTLDPVLNENGQYNVANEQGNTKGAIAPDHYVYDNENDEVIYLEKDPATDKVIGRKIVHIIFSTDLTDGVALSDNHIQFNFVIWDDVNNQLTAVDIEAGDYKVIFNRAYNKGTLSIAQLNGTVKEDYNLGGFAEDELLDLNVPKPFYVTATANSDITIGADKKVIVTVGATAGATVVKDSGGNTLDMTIEQLDTVVFDEFNKSLFELANGTAYFETILKPQNATVKSSSDIEVDLSDTIATNIIYQGNVLILQGVK